MRDLIRSEIAAIQPLDALEHEHWADALAWVDSPAELFRQRKPATPPKHLISYVALVDGAHLLLVDHRDAGLWLPPGGHVEPGEHPRATVARELQEELGVDAEQPIEDPLMISIATTQGHSAGHVDVCLWYVVRRERDRPLSIDDSEFYAVRWFPLSSLPWARSDPHLRRFVAKLVAQDDLAARARR
jgi:8-oxo-dGTP pyrophosphatase MutT (NUDIX family)